MGRVYSPALWFYTGCVTFLASDIQMEVPSTEDEHGLASWLIAGEEERYVDQSHINQPTDF